MDHVTTSTTEPKSKKGSKYRVWKTSHKHKQQQETLKKVTGQSDIRPSSDERTAVVNSLLEGAALDDIKGETHRTLSLTDDFEDYVLGTAKVIKKYWGSYLDDHATLKRKRGLFSKSSEQVTDELMIEKFSVLRNNAQRWLNRSENKEGAGDDTRRAKVKACEQFVEMARQGIAEVESRRLSARSEQLQQDAGGKADDQLIQRHQALQKKLIQGQAGADERDEFRQTDARLLAVTYGSGDPEDGSTQGMKLVADVDGKVAYAFKPLAGESTQMGTPKGSGTVREVLASRLFAEIDKQCNLGFRWPKTGIGALEAGKPGALIEGLPGVPCDHQDLDKSIFKKLPKASVQKLLLGNLASLQLDAKPGNAFIDTSGEVPDLRPSDGGAIAPNEMMLADQVMGDNQQVVGRSFVEGLGHAGFDEPLEELVRGEFLKIDTTALGAALGDEMQRCAAAGLDPTTLEVAPGCQLMLDGIATLQKLIRSQPKITPKQLMEAFHQDFVLPLAKGGQASLIQKYTSEYDAVQKRYPELMATFEQVLATPGFGGIDIEALWRRFCPPEKQQLMAQFDRLGKANLQQAGVKVPILGNPADYVGKVKQQFPNFQQG